MKSYLKFMFFLLVLASFSFTVPPRKARIFLIGGASMCDKPLNVFPETGWGTVFAKFFDTSKAAVYNRDLNAMESSSFREEKRWTHIMDSLQQGDIVLIQFGKSEEVQIRLTSKARQQFNTSLAQYIDDTRLKKAIPVLITPTARRSFNNEGKIDDSYDDYSDLVRKVANVKNIPLIELNKKSQAVIQAYGQENSRKLFNYLEPGQHPNYPEGRSDNVNFSEAGARKMAEIVYTELKTQNPGGISEYFFKPAPKK